MGKVKIKRKSTLIDMTAMSDVTVLLLTFFMLTSTFLQKEPVTVITPSSVSEIKVPVSNLVSILVNERELDNGTTAENVYLSILGDADPENADIYGTEALRAAVLQEAVSEWNRLNPSKKVHLTEEMVNNFSKMNMFGFPFAQLEEVLKMPQGDLDKYMEDTNLSGIPINDNHDLATPNEFQIWMMSMRKAGSDNFQQALKKGEGIAVKADKSAQYQTMHRILDNLQTLKMNRFSIMTALKSAED